MNKQFKQDLESARDAEILVRDLLAGATQDYDFHWVGDNPTYYHKGDIVAVNKINGNQIFIEVKDDSRIAEPGNILCEEEVEFFDCDYCKKGNMYNDFDVYVVVSKQAREIYVIRGEALKANYKQGYKKYIPHAEQATDCYLFPLRRLKELGGVISTIGYDLENRRAWLSA